MAATTSNVELAPASAEREKLLRQKAKKALMWVSIVSMVMLFAGATSAYIIRYAESDWLSFPLPNQLVYTSTIFIIASSLTLLGARMAIKKEKPTLASAGIIATFLLGLGFGWSQWAAWGELVNNGIYFTGHTANAAGSFLYVLTGLHVAHIVGGVLALLFTSIKSLIIPYTPANITGFEILEIFWHFLGVLWVYLLVFLLNFR